MKNKNASNAVVFKMQNGFLYFIWNLKSQDDDYSVLKKNGHRGVYKGCSQTGHGFFFTINSRTHLQHACS